MATFHCRSHLILLVLLNLMFQFGIEMQCVTVIELPAILDFTIRIVVGLMSAEDSMVAHITEVPGSTFVAMGAFIKQGKEEPAPQI